MVKKTGYFSLILFLILLFVGIAFSQPKIIVLDNIPKTLLTQFDPVHAILDNKTQITSIQNNAVVPKNYAYPLIEWQGPENLEDPFLIEIKSRQHQLNVLLMNNHWQPEGDQFKPFLKEKEAWVTLYYLNKGKTYKSQSVRLEISNRPLNDRIVFRQVQPLFNPVLINGINIFSFDQRAPSRLMELDGTCVGCHSYSSNSAYFSVKKGTERKLMTVTRDGQKFQLGYQPIGEFSFVAISPDGNFAAIVKNLTGEIVVKKSFVEPFDYPYRTGDIYCYDIKKNTVTPLKGASDPNFIEDMPFFSPDGKYLLFSRYQYSEKNGIPGVHSMDLYKVPFNNGNGGEPKPVPNASSNQLVQYFARYSPNGKWISFCRGEGVRGIYARKSSDIYLLSADGNTLTKMNLNKEDHMDSWHDWSSDSHWLIFSSNREKNRLTSLYLVYIDENGKDYPPVKLFGDENLKVNTPQFLPKTLNLETVKNIGDYIERIYAETKK